jgi:hypothetical protein
MENKKSNIDPSPYPQHLSVDPNLMQKTSSSALNSSKVNTTEYDDVSGKKLHISKQRSAKASLQPRNSLGQFVKSNKSGIRQVNDWVEFQKINKGKYSRKELSKLYKEQKSVCKTYSIINE